MFYACMVYTGCTICIVYILYGGNNGVSPTYMCTLSTSNNNNLNNNCNTSLNNNNVNGGGLPVLCLFSKKLKSKDGQICNDISIDNSYGDI